MSCKNNLIEIQPNIIPDYIQNLKQENEERRAVCKSNVHVVLNVTKEQIDLIPHCCHQRNCSKCYTNRVSKKTDKFTILMNATRKGASTVHCIPTWGEVPVKEYTKTTYSNHRADLNKFTRWLNKKGTNAWGIGVYENHYSKTRGSFRPHAHLMIFGIVPKPQEVIQKWEEITGSHHHI